MAPFGNSGSGIAPQHQAVRERGPISAAMEARGKLQAQLRESIAVLDERLHPILAPDQPTPSRDDSAKADRPTRHVEQLDTANNDLQQMITWIQSLTTRIEL
jgi:hypothetical protein